MAFATRNVFENAPVANASLIPIHDVCSDDQTFTVALHSDFESTTTCSSYTVYIEGDYGV